MIGSDEADIKLYSIGSLIQLFKLLLNLGPERNVLEGAGSLDTKVLAVVRIRCHIILTTLIDCVTLTINHPIFRVVDLEGSDASLANVNKNIPQVRSAAL